MTRTFLCIGAGPGIGLETARRFAKEGFDIVLAARVPDKLGAQLDQLKADGVDVTLEPLDAADGAAVTALVEKYAPTLEVLLYNAAVMRFGTDLIGQTAHEIDSDLQVGLASGVRAAHAAIPAMVARKSGTILLTGGGLADAPNALAVTLTLGKAGLRTLAQALSPSLKQENVNIASLTVNANVAPASDEARAIAEAYWRIHASAKETWMPEIRYP